MTTTRKEGHMAPIYRQGDVLIVPGATIPAGTTKVKREHGRVVLAHGEVTGHHHSIAERGVQLVSKEEADELRMWMTVTAPDPVELTHQEHDTILIPPGTYEVRRQREYAPGGIRNVAD